MKKNILVAPVVKWVGGKRQLIPELSALLPKRITSYCEPFLGGGALLFHLQPSKVILNDINNELINVYMIIKNNVDELIEDLKKHKNESEYFYYIRGLDRNKEDYKKMNNIQRASRFLFLNKTCYNGLFRVNNSGEFNSPFGGYKNPNIVNAPVLRAVSNYFNEIDITFYSGDYQNLCSKLDKSFFVYMDPPYDPISQTSNFTGYSKGGFSKEDQIKLRDFCIELDRRSIKFMLSNSSTEFIHEIYSMFHIHSVQAKRLVNSIAAKRGNVSEVVVCNYGR